MKPPKKCKKCAGLILGGRCPCASVKPHYKPAAQGSVEATHFYQIIKTIRTKSWTDTGYRAPHSNSRTQMRMLYQSMPGGFSIKREPSYWSAAEVEFFVYRCEIAKAKNRSEFAGLMASRLTLFFAGLTQPQVCDRLQIPRSELLWLDQQIRKFVWFPHRNAGCADYLKAYRKMKAGVALAIIRRQRMGYNETPLGYKQTQVLTFQQYNPLQMKDAAIYEGENDESTSTAEIDQIEAEIEQEFEELQERDYV